MPVNQKTQTVIITIDGPAGTGKSTLAHTLARRLGVDFLDTGAMYRAAALIALEQDIDPSNGVALAAAIERAGMRFDWDADPPRMLLGRRDVSSRIRDLDVSGIVSIVAAQPEVRVVLVQQQRRIARAHPRLITEGRDQGSIVFPEAPVRFFIEADIQVRADRRARQLREAGKSVDPKQIIDDLTRRDRIDSQRSDAPLICPEGAIIISTTDRSIDQVVDEMQGHILRALPEADFDR